MLLLLDATQGVTDQDAHIAGYILESGRAVVLAVNKWDAVDAYQRETAAALDRARLAFLKFAPVHHHLGHQAAGARARCGQAIAEAHASAMRKMPTPVLTRLLHGGGAAPGAQARRHVPARSCATRTRAA